MVSMKIPLSSRNGMPDGRPRRALAVALVCAALALPGCVGAPGPVTVLVENAMDSTTRVTYLVTLEGRGVESGAFEVEPHGFASEEIELVSGTYTLAASREGTPTVEEQFQVKGSLWGGPSLGLSIGVRPDGSLNILIEHAD